MRGRVNLLGGGSGTPSALVCSLCETDYEEDDKVTMALAHKFTKNYDFGTRSRSNCRDVVVLGELVRSGSCSRCFFL